MSTSEPGEGRRALSSEEAAEILKNPRIGYIVEGGERGGIWSGNGRRFVRRNEDGTVSPEDRHDFHPHLNKEDIVLPVEAEAEYEVGLRLRPDGVARFGFAGEPPEGWSTAERRTLADARLRAEIEDGEPETIRFPWGVALMFLAIVVGSVLCLGGSLWFIVDHLKG